MSKSPLNIVFLGEDSFSNIVLQSLIKAGHIVKLVISPYYDNLIYKRLEKTCKNENIAFERYRKINSEETLKRVVEVKPDLCVISHFERLIKAPILEVPRLGFINLHPSLLPMYRGMSPQHWPIINGEKETGVTVHYVDAMADTGDIIIQKKIQIDNDMYVSDLQNIWIKIYDTIVVEAIECILKGEPVISQLNLNHSYYGRLTNEQCQIKLTDSCDYVYNLIRGVSMPYHGAEFDDVIIWKAHHAEAGIVNQIESQYNTNGIYLNTEFGDFLKLRDGILLIDKYKKCGNGKENNYDIERIKTGI